VKAAPGSDSYPDIDFLHEIGLGISAAPLAKVLGRIVLFVSSVTESDSCFIYIQDGRELVLRASKNLHSEVIGRLRIQVGQGITGWVAAHKKPVAIGRNAYSDPRFQSFNELPEDRSSLICPALWLRLSRYARFWLSAALRLFGAAEIYQPLLQNSSLIGFDLVETDADAHRGFGARHLAVCRECAVVMGYAHLNSGAGG